MNGSAEARLRAAGHRVTAQRLLVFDIIGSQRHVTPEEVRAEAQRRGARVDLSTVYRTLDVLEAVGLINHAHLGHGSPTYHPVDEHPHVHLVCHRCGKIDSIAATGFNALALEVRAATGFAVDVSHSALHGICAQCQKIEADDQKVHRSGKV